MQTIPEITQQFNTLVQNSRNYIGFLAQIMAIIWGINLINWASGSALNILGNIPRDRIRLLGIGLAWIWHANFNHLFFNSIPLFTLNLMLISIYKLTIIKINLIIIILEGVMVWLLGRNGNHIGASGLIAGIFGFLLSYSYASFSAISLILGMITLYYFSGILISIFPTKDTISWESHLFGLIAGITTFFINQYYPLGRLLWV